MKIFAWVICLLASMLAGLVLITGVMTANGAPQQAAAAAIAVGIAIIPYCFARAVSEMSR